MYESYKGVDILGHQVDFPVAREKNEEPSFIEGGKNELVSLEEVVFFVRKYAILFFSLSIIGAVAGFYQGIKTEFYSSHYLFGRSHADPFFIKEEEKLQAAVASLFRDLKFSDYFSMKMIEKLQKQQRNARGLGDIFSSFRSSGVTSGAGIDSSDQELSKIKTIFSSFLQYNTNLDIKVGAPPSFYISAKNGLYELGFSLPQKGLSLLFMQASVQSFNEVVLYANKTALDRLLAEKRESKRKLLEEFSLLQERQKSDLFNLQVERSQLYIDFYRLMKRIESVDNTNVLFFKEFKKYELGKASQDLTENYLDSLERRAVLKHLAFLQEKGLLSEKKWEEFFSQFNFLVNKKTKSDEKLSLLEAPYLLLQKQVIARSEDEVKQVDLSAFSLPGMDIPAGGLVAAEASYFDTVDVFNSKKITMTVAGLFSGIIMALCLALCRAFFVQVKTNEKRKNA